MSPSYCGSLTYTIENIDSTAINSNLNSNVFTFDGSTRTLDMYSTDIFNKGNYILTIIGTLNPYGATAFDLNVFLDKQCTDMFITSYKPADITFNLFVDSTQTTSFSPWTEDILGCGSFSYIAKLSNGDPLPSFI